MRKEQELVEKLFKKYKTANPFELCDHLNVDVRYKNLGKIRGMYRYNRRNKFITINSALELSSTARAIVCAHELGHLLLHNDENRIMMDYSVCSGIYKPSRYENEANRFAIYLFLKEHHIKQPHYALLSKHTGLTIDYLQMIL